MSVTRGTRTITEEDCKHDWLVVDTLVLLCVFALFALCFCRYYFYKNLVFTLMQIFFAFSTGFTGQTLHDAWIITGYRCVAECALTTLREQSVMFPAHPFTHTCHAATTWFSQRGRL